MRKHRKIWMISAAFMTAAILTVTLISHVTQVLAAESTFSGITQIVEDNSPTHPFRIVEVVPDTNEGAIGYYIKGEEPMHDALAKLQSGSDRYHYVENLQTLLMNQGIMGAAGTTNLPLEQSDYEELYQGSMPEDELEQTVSDGNYRAFIRDQSISENYVSGNRIPGCTISTNSLSVNSIYNYKMAVSMNGTDLVSGNYIPYYEPLTTDVSGNTISENDAYRFFKGENQSFTVSDDQVGIFDPYLTADGDGIEYQAVFEASKGRIGYVPLVDRTEIAEGDPWQDTFVEGTPVYGVVDGVYECAGLLKNQGGVVAFRAVDAHGARVVTSLDGEDIQIIEEEEPSPEENAAEDVTVTEVTSLDGEEQTGAVTGNGYYLVQFVYSTENNEETHYQVCRMEEAPDAPYHLNKEIPLVANGAGMGLINPNFDELSVMDIVYQYVEENGIYTMMQEQGTETAVRDCQIYYRGGIENHEWFRKYVFDRNDKNEKNEAKLEPVYMEVETVTARQLQTYDLSQASMLYVTNAKGEFIPATQDITYEFADYGGENDITRRRIIEVLSEIVNSKFPVMADRTLITDAAVNTTKMGDFGKVLDQPSLKTFFAEHAAKSDAELDSMTIPTAYFESINHHHVNESVYIFNQNPYTGGLSLTNGFRNKFSDSDVKNSFQEIAKEIKTENDFIDEENKSGANKKKLSTDINEAVAIKYILSMISKRGVLGKTELQVLELQPMYYEVTDGVRNLGCSDLEVVDGPKVMNDKGEYVLDTWNLMMNGKTVIEESKKKIHVTTMSTSEYIGKIEDINSEYDLIYIGLNIGTGGTDGGGVRMNRYTSGTYSGRTRYNDSNMNGLVYTNVGDQVQGESWLGENSTSEEYRYSGNDITEEKVKALEEYVSAGYPVIFAQNFYTGTGNNLKVYSKSTSDGSKCTGYIDNSSNMYEFADWAKTKLKKGENVLQFLSTNTNGVDRDLLTKYVDLAKPEIDCYDTSGVALDADGNKYLNFYFQILNKGTITKSSEFDCNLYLDTNADGKFSKEKEKVTDYTITDSSGNSASKLRSGVTYHLKKLISNEYSGVVTWKLEAAQTNDKNRRDSATGNFEVQGTEKIQIHALQIMSSREATSTGDWKRNNWNMEESLNTPGSLLRKYAKESAAVKNYDISVESITADDYVERFHQHTMNLDSYDMLIMGFADSYVLSEKSENQDALNAIAAYIQSGKSVLFTHDTTSYKNNWGNLFNKTIREKVGLDRYGDSGDTTGCKEIPYQPNTSRTKKLSNKQGYINQVLCDAKQNSSELYNLDYRGKVTDHSGNQSEFSDTVGAGLGATTSGTGVLRVPTMRSAIRQVNAGQVTDYPYKITTKAAPILDTIAKTHSQYYQLDMAGDFDNDNENDIVVWYCLEDSSNTMSYTNSRNVYKYSQNDVRNNYYIYNRGNVTYSGAGHSWIENEKYSGSEQDEGMEVKLFINTLVASYSTGVKAPLVSVVDHPTNKDATIDCIYAPFDYGLNKPVGSLDVSGNYVSGNEIDESNRAYFYAADTNIIKDADSVQLSAKVYYEDSTSAHTIQVGSQAVKVSELDLGRYPIVDPVTKAPLTETGTTADGAAIANSRKIADKMVYQLTLPPSVILGTSSSKEIYVEVSENVRLTATSPVKTLSADDHVAYTRVQLFDLD